MAKSNILTRSLKKNAAAMLGENRLAEARELYARICRLEPTDVPSWFSCGVVSSQLGDVEGTEKCCRRVLALEPRSADALFLLANALEIQGRLDEAEAKYRQALQIQPASTQGHAHLGMVLQRAGKLDDACRSYEESLRHDPYQPIIHYNLGVVLNELKQPADAERSYRESLRLMPDDSKAHANLGFVLRAQGRPEEAAASYREALRIDPESAEIHYNLGLTLKDLGQYEEAAASHANALAQNPNYIEAYMGRAYALQAVAKYTDALADYEQVIQLNPDHAEAYHSQGVLHVLTGQQARAIGRFQQAVRLNPDYVEAYLALGSAWLSLNRPEEAKACIDHAMQIAPERAEVLVSAAMMAEHAGDLNETYRILAPLVEAQHPDINVSLLYARLSSSLGREADAIARVEKHLQNGSPLTAEQIRAAHYCLGRLYDRRKEYDAAFAHYRHGNESERSSFDRELFRKQIDTIITVQNALFMSQMPRASVCSERPLFIVGMPRSGTTLVEQILGSHPEVHAAGELLIIRHLTTSLPQRLKTEATYPQCLTTLDQETTDQLARQYLEALSELSPDARRVTDKLPANFMFLGFIEQLFPGARIIHCRRDPMDTCLSCYFMDFAGRLSFSYDLTDLGFYYRQYERLMEHWRQVISLPIYEVRYESLVDEPERISRELVAFSGLEWDERCLRFHENRRMVATASYDQVRQPIYRKSIARWKHYEHHLGPLKEALARQDW